MGKICAILPLKAFDSAKSRLSSVLSAAERAGLARRMAVHVLETLAAVRQIDRIVVAGQEPTHAALAAAFGCDFLADDPALDVSGNVARAVRRIADEAETVLYLAADLPLLSVEDIRELLARGRNGVTICRALRDGGTNALLARPPAAARFRFGGGSAKRHAAAARAAGWPARIVDLPAFQRDIDEPSDLEWLRQRDEIHGTIECVNGPGRGALASFGDVIDGP
ncbi:MAG TPA: 2-phospho-L-lactate guanylyltransferase [Woeseiaceae bacterium]|nr:2-phospho-L-lactate guanylyltransferase [Woeseiaceae bacterium]